MPTCALLPVTGKRQLHTNVMQSYRDARDCEALQFCAYSSCVKRAARANTPQKTACGQIEALHRFMKRARAAPHTGPETRACIWARILDRNLGTTRWERTVRSHPVGPTLWFNSRAPQVGP